MSAEFSWPLWASVKAVDDGLSLCLERVTDAENNLNQHMASIQSVLAETRSMITELRAAGPQAFTTSEPKEEVNAGEDQSLAFQEQQGTDAQVVVVAMENTKEMLAEQRAALEEKAEDVAMALGVTAAEVLKAHDLFTKSDADGSGKLDVRELKPVLEALSGTPIPEQDIGKMLHEFDKNHDGSLNFEEFLFCYCHTPNKKDQHLEEWVHGKEARLPSHFRASVVGVKVSAVKAYLHREIEEMHACLTLPSVLVLFIMFLASVTLHRGNYVIRGMEESFRMGIEENANFAFSGVVPFENGRMGHKNIYDINTFADFWSWFDVGLTPLLFPESWDVSEARANTAALCQKPVDALQGAGWTFNESVLSQVAASSQASDLGPLCEDLGADPEVPKDFFRKPPYLFFNSIVAGLRLSQEQVPLRVCKEASLHLRAYDSKCLEDVGYWIEPDLDEALGMAQSRLNKPGASTEHFLSQWTQADVRKRAKELEDSAWLNQRSGKVELLYTTYNAHQNIFTALYMYFLVNRGGHIYKFIKPMSVWLDPYQSVWSYVLDAAFAGMVLKLFVEEARELIMGNCYQRGLKQGLLKYFSNFKNLVDWLCIGYSVIIFWLWAVQVLALGELKTSLETGSTEVPGTWTGAADRLKHFELVDNFSAAMSNLETAVAFYPLAIGARFISAFHGQPRLALVTDTLFAATVDLVHFGVVMVSMMLIYTVSAQLLFGREVDGFETLGRSFITIFRGLLGDMDYEAIARVGRPAAAFWFVTFMVLLNLVMLNMLLAIVFDNYSQVRQLVNQDAETFWSQAREILHRWRMMRTGSYIALEQVLIPLETYPGNLLTVSSFMKLVPVKKPQALQILQTADKIVADEEAAEENIGDQLRALNLRVQQLQIRLKQQGDSGSDWVRTVPIEKTKKKEVVVGI